MGGVKQSARFVPLAIVVLLNLPSCDWLFPTGNGLIKPVTGVSVNPAVDVPVGGTAQLVASITPSNATNQNVSWSTDNASVATVAADGTVRGVSVGTARITVTTYDGRKTSVCTVSVVIPVAGVSLRSSTTIQVGGTERLIPAINPANATNQSATWSTDNALVATVASDGTVTGVSSGTARITVTTADGGKTASCTVTVVSQAVAVTGVSLDTLAATVAVGNTRQLSATIAPSGATNQAVTWSSSNTNVATVSSSGLVTAVSTGTATITVTTADGGKTANCTVTVVIPVTAVTLKTSTTISVGGTEQLTAVINPANATNQAVSWSTGNAAVATVASDGTVTGVSAGTILITVTTADGGKTASCTVTVTVPVTGVSLNKTTLSLAAGGTEQLVVAFTPSNASNRAVTWQSSVSGVASVSSSGMVSALSGGTTTITVTTADGGKTASCVVTVTVPVSSVSLKTSTTILVGGVEQLVAVINPGTATNKNVSWTSSNAVVATVGSDGVVTGVSAGTALITVTTADGAKTSSCTVTVTQQSVAVTGITLNKTSTVISMGVAGVAYAEQLTGTVVPSNATNQNISWTSTDPYVANVNSTGLVTAALPGTTTVIATTVDGNKMAWCTVTVVQLVTNVSLDKSSDTLVPGGMLQLVKTISPANATNAAVTWSTSNAAVATVNQSGLVTAVGGGTATITATATDGGGASAASIVTVRVVVAFDKNDASATGTMLPQAIPAGTASPLAICGFNRIGYSFAGWAMSAGGAVVYADQASYTMGTATVTLYAKWTANSYTVSFDAQGGSAPSPASLTVTYDSPYGTLATTSRTGYTFGGWWTGASGTGSQILSTGTVAITANQTLYAKWTANS